MSSFLRWKLATPLIMLSLMGLAAILAGAWLFWPVQSNVERALTVLMAVMLAMNTALSVSIGTDRTLDDIPWLRIATWAVFYLLVCGVSLVRG